MSFETEMISYLCTAFLVSVCIIASQHWTTIYVIGVVQGCPFSDQPWFVSEDGIFIYPDDMPDSSSSWGRAGELDSSFEVQKG